MRPLWTEIEPSTRAAPARADRAVARGPQARGAGVALAARNRPRQLDIASTVRHFRPGAMALYASITRLLAPEDAEPLARRADELRGAGVPEDLAARVAALPIMFSALDIVTVADEMELDVERVAAVHFRLGQRLELHWLRDRIVALPRDDRWRALARAALRDDLYSIHRELTPRCCARRPPARSRRAGGPWVEANSASARTLQTLRRDPQGTVLRHHHAARGRARGAQPASAASTPVSSSQTSHSRRATSSSRAAPFGETARVAALLAEAVRADVGAALEAGLGGGVERGQRAHLGALGDHRVADPSPGGRPAAARRTAGWSPRSRGGRPALDGRARGAQPPVQLEREQQVGELRLPVGAPAEVVAVAVQVVEGDRPVRWAVLDSVTTRASSRPPSCRAAAR